MWAETLDVTFTITEQNIQAADHADCVFASPTQNSNES